MLLVFDAFFLREGSSLRATPPLLPPICFLLIAGPGEEEEGFLTTTMKGAASVRRITVQFFRVGEINNVCFAELPQDYCCHY